MKRGQTKPHAHDLDLKRRRYAPASSLASDRPAKPPIEIMRLSWFHNLIQDALEQPFPDEWKQWLDTSVRHVALLTPDERARIEDDLRIFAHRKFWEGAGGLEITDRIQVIISAQACLLTLGMVKHDYFPNVDSIIVYPTSYRAPATSSTIGGVMEHAVQGREGEAHGNGPVVLSWSDAVSGDSDPDDGHNLVLHEFAHKLDFRNGAPDGVPTLKTQQQYDRWSEVMSKEFASLVESAKHSRHSFLSAYGATNAAEFFAVATEAYFEQSVKMKRDHPDLYEVLLGFYGIDWAQRVTEHAPKSWRTPGDQ
jgi:Mlc titration factor MtfA (ptsG expression regulator)